VIAELQDIADCQLQLTKSLCQRQASVCESEHCS
jgi:hypothetical protein